MYKKWILLVAISAVIAGAATYFLFQERPSVLAVNENGQVNLQMLPGWQSVFDQGDNSIRFAAKLADSEKRAAGFIELFCRKSVTAGPFISLMLEIPRTVAFAPKDDRTVLGISGQTLRSHFELSAHHEAPDSRVRRFVVRATSAEAPPARLANWIEQVVFLRYYAKALLENDALVYRIDQRPPELVIKKFSGLGESTDRKALERAVSYCFTLE